MFDIDKFYKMKGTGILKTTILIPPMTISIKFKLEAKNFLLLNNWDFKFDLDTINPNPIYVEILSH